MNKTKFCIYDKKAKYYQEPFDAFNNADALRAFENGINSENSNLGANPEDYMLFKVGQKWDPIKGAYIQDGEQISLGTALEYVKLREE